MSIDEETGQLEYKLSRYNSVNDRIKDAERNLNRGVAGSVIFCAGILTMAAGIFAGLPVALVGVGIGIAGGLIMDTVHFDDEELIDLHEQRDELVKQLTE